MRQTYSRFYLAVVKQVNHLASKIIFSLLVAGFLCLPSPDELDVQGTSGVSGDWRTRHRPGTYVVLPHEDGAFLLGSTQPTEVELIRPYIVHYGNNLTVDWSLVLPSTRRAGVGCRCQVERLE